MREMVRRGQGTHICEPFERSFFVTNWSAAWKGLDFGPAVKAGENEASAVKLLVLGESKILDGPDRCKETSARHTFHEKLMPPMQSLQPFFARQQKDTGVILASHRRQRG
jgi:hypothetical protein